MSILRPKNIKIRHVDETSQELKLSKPMPYSNNQGYAVYINYNNKKLYIQTPRMLNLFGLGIYNDEKRQGIYVCATCDQKLFDSKTKYESGSGWPAFYAPSNEANIVNVQDTSHGMIRTEVKCSKCDSHLGHVFPDGPEPTGLRYCINSIVLNFIED